MRKKVIFTLILTMALTFGYTVYSAKADQQELQDTLLRFHILANSNGEMDQRVKLEIRDAVAALLSFEGQHSREEAVAKVESRFLEMEAVANGILRERGLSYTAEASIDQVHFPVREYGAFTIPAGEYLSLVLRLGAGEGANWWCVMYPPLCYAAEKVVNEDELTGFFIEHLSESANALISSKEPRVVYKSKVLELLEKMNRE